MKIAKTILLIIIFAPVLVFADAAKINFNGEDYVFRWSQNTQFEFTPEGQENLSKWVDMITLNYFMDVKDSDSLASLANRVLYLYRQEPGKIILTNSVPRTKEKPAEHLMIVVLGQKNSLEFAQTRFKLLNGVGVGITYSHKIYGQNAGPQMSDWMAENGPKLEGKIMKLDSIPTYNEIKTLQKL